MKALAVGLALAATILPTAAQETIKTERASITVTPVTEGLSHPWGLAFLPNGSMLVTEKGGTLRIIGTDGSKGEPIQGVPKVDARSQGGLLALALHPKFSESRWVYISYSEPGEDGRNSTAVARGKLAEDGGSLSDVQVIFSQKPKLPSTMHYGSRLVFDREGRLYVTLGERSKEEFRGQAQELDSHLGKIVRINDDGSVPEDNPFVGTQGALPEIWSYGHRNIQGATLHPETGALWEVEHGPKGGDEINIPEPGKNYGWPIVSHGVNYDGSPVGTGKKQMKGMEAPLHTWTPVIAPGNMTFYTGDMFPEWKGNLLIAGLKVTSLVRLEMDGARVAGEERILSDLGQRIRDVVQGPDGALYVLTDEDNGAIWKIGKANTAGG